MRDGRIVWKTPSLLSNLAGKVTVCHKHIVMNVSRKISLIGFVYWRFDIAFVCNTRHDECVITQLQRPYIPSRKLRHKDIRLYLIP